MIASNIRALTGLRGFAAWWVVLYHFQEPISMIFGSNVVELVKKGYLAVDLFFILSGFVIYINYGKNFTKISIEVVFEFYVKRIARIYPLYLVVLILFLLNPLAIYLFSSSENFQDRYDIYYFVLSIFMVQNWGFTGSIRWNIPAWSISTEFASYLLFPFLAYLFNNAKNYGKYTIHVILMLTILSIGLVFSSLAFSSLGDSIPEIGLFRCVLEFLLGMIAGKIYVENELSYKYRNHLVFSIVLISWVGYYFNLPDYLYMPSIFFLVVLFFSFHTGFHAKIFGSRPLFFLGEISYSTYLIHFFIKDWVKFLSPSIGISSLFYYLFFIFFSSVLLYRLVEVPGRQMSYGLMMKFLKRNSYVK